MKRYLSIILLSCLLLVCSLTLVEAQTTTTNLSWSTNYGSASEKISFTVTLSTINKPSVTYSKSGYGAYYNGISYKYAGISNSLTKYVKEDVGKYTITSQAAWTNSFSYASVKGAKKTTKYTYKGSLN